MDALRKRVLDHPDDFEARLDLAELLIASSLNDEAYHVLEETVPLRPDDPDILRMSARLCYERKLFNEAKERLERASRQGLPDPKSDLLLSRVFLALGNARRAEYYYNLAIRRDRSLEDPAYLATINPQRRIPIKIGALSQEQMSFSGETTGLTFNDVGGMDDVKEHMRMNIILPLQKPDLFRQYGKRIGGGILMFGPPGCGKTYLSKALAGECQATFYNVGIHEILDMFLGQSEKNMHGLFETARRNAPAIVFIDEIDALGQKRGDGSWGRALRGTVNTLLNELDNVGSSNKPILVVGATNTPWSVDPALRRPGRFDRVIFVPPPDQLAREEILKLHLRGKPIDEIDYEKIASKLEKFSGADIRNLIDRAVEDTIRKAVRSGKTELITTSALLEAVGGIRPSTLEWLATANDYVRYSNEGGIYDQVKAYLDENR